MPLPTVGRRVVENVDEKEGVEQKDPRTIALDQHIISSEYPDSLTRSFLTKYIHPELPFNARVIRASNDNTISGTIRFDTRAPSFDRLYEGVYKTYSIKMLPNKIGHDILRGEYNSLRALSDIYAPLVPNPIAWGTLQQNANSHFLLCDAHDMDSKTVDTERFIAALAIMHRKSAAPGSRFGFHVPTFVAGVAQDNRGRVTWEEYFSVNFRSFVEVMGKIDGAAGVVCDDLTEAILMKVIPRLLRPLESGERSVTPVLLHGNVSPYDTPASLISDGSTVGSPGAFYGHNEYDLRNFAPDVLGSKFLEAYHRLMPVSEPKQDFDHRLALYRLRSLLHECCLHPEDKYARQAFVLAMKNLVDWFYTVEGGSNERLEEGEVVETDESDGGKETEGKDIKTEGLTEE